MKILNTVTGLAAAAAVSLFALSASAQNYPERNITMVVPFAAGGPTDTVARLVAESMSKDLGQQIIVENVGGAGGTLGAGRVAAADPDGYTVLLHHIGMATSATLYRKLAYDTTNAFEYVGLVTEVPMTILSRKNLETKDLKGLIDYAKANKDKVTVANAGIGAASHLCGMLFMSAIETPLVTVPYKGTGPAMTDLLGGQVDIMCDQTTNTTKQIQGGTVKAYAVTTAKRLDVLPDVPTVVEAGLPKLAFQLGSHGVPVPALALVADGCAGGDTGHGPWRFRRFPHYAQGHAGKTAAAVAGCRALHGARSAQPSRHGSGAAGKRGGRFLHLRRHQCGDLCGPVGVSADPPRNGKRFAKAAGPAWRSKRCGLFLAAGGRKCR